MSTQTRLLALLATMTRINPTMFASVAAYPFRTLSRCGLHLPELPESVVRAWARRTPELTAGVTGVHLITEAAANAQEHGQAAQDVLVEHIEDWCNGPAPDCLPWPRQLPTPDWLRTARCEESWREHDMFYSAAAAMAAVATQVEDEPTQAVVYQLSERLLERADRARLARVA